MSRTFLKKTDTARPVATEGVQGSTEAAQGSMLAHFKPKQQGWDKQQDDAWKEKVAEFIAEKYLPLAIVESASFREMIGALNPKAQIPCSKTIRRIMENMRVDLNEELGLLMRGEFVCVTSDSWTSAAGNTYLGITYHWIDVDWNLNSMTARLVETARTPFSDPLPARASFLGYLPYFLPC